MAADPKTVKAWTLALSVMCVMKADEDVQMKVALYADALCDQFGPEAFTSPARVYVAARHRFFPAYAELADTLAEWRRANYEPKPLAITSDDPEAIKAREAANLAAEWSDFGTVAMKLDEIIADLEADLPFAALAARVFRTTIERHAPQHLHLIDTAMDERDRRNAQRGRANNAAAIADKPALPVRTAAPVSPEVLAKLRAAAGIVMPPIRVPA